MGKRVYLAGPMRGIAEFNFPAFDMYAAQGRLAGFNVVSPADMDREVGFDGIGCVGDDSEWTTKMDAHETLLRDVNALRHCDAIALMPGWENSRGVAVELSWARLTGKEVLDARTYLPFDPTSKPVPASGTDGTKFDEGKPRFDLLSPEALDGLVGVLTFGARKYSDRNWEKGIRFGRVFGAAMRHLWAWWRGADVDDETGMSHLDHAACCIHFLSTFVKRGRMDLDDRPKSA